MIIGQGQKWWQAGKYRNESLCGFPAVVVGIPENERFSLQRIKEGRMRFHRASRVEVVFGKTFHHEKDDVWRAFISTAETMEYLHTPIKRSPRHKRFAG